MHHDELFEYTKGYATLYALLLLITLVPWVQLTMWYGAQSFKSSPGNPMLPHNVRWHLESLPTLWVPDPCGQRGDCCCYR